MSALTRRGSRGLFLDLFDLLDPLDALHLWLGGLAMRMEEGIHNGRYLVIEISIGLKAAEAADHAVRNIPVRQMQHITPN
jgi:hypothetical protein